MHIFRDFFNPTNSKMLKKAYPKLKFPKVTILLVHTTCFSVIAMVGDVAVTWNKLASRTLALNSQPFLPPPFVPSPQPDPNSLSPSHGGAPPPPLDPLHPSPDS
jgi:hypothetical protein